MNKTINLSIRSLSLKMSVFIIGMTRLDLSHVTVNNGIIDDRKFVAPPPPPPVNKCRVPGRTT